MEIKCPKCGQTYNVKTLSPGDSFTCTGCGTSYRIEDTSAPQSQTLPNNTPQSTPPPQIAIRKLQTASDQQVTSGKKTGLHAPLSPKRTPTPDLASSLSNGKKSILTVVCAGVALLVICSASLSILFGSRQRNPPSVAERPPESNPEQESSAETQNREGVRGNEEDIDDGEATNAGEESDEEEETTEANGNSEKNDFVKLPRGTLYHPQVSGMSEMMFQFVKSMIEKHSGDLTKAEECASLKEKIAKKYVMTPTVKPFGMDMVQSRQESILGRKPLAEKQIRMEMLKLFDSRCPRVELKKETSLMNVKQRSRITGKVYKITPVCIQVENTLIHIMDHESQIKADPEYRRKAYAEFIEQDMSSEGKKWEEADEAAKFKAFDEVKRMNEENSYFCENGMKTVLSMNELTDRLVSSHFEEIFFARYVNPRNKALKKAYSQAQKDKYFESAIRTLEEALEKNPLSSYKTDVAEYLSALKNAVERSREFEQKTDKEILADCKNLLSAWLNDMRKGRDTGMYWSNNQYGSVLHLRSVGSIHRESTVTKRKNRFRVHCCVMNENNRFPTSLDLLVTLKINKAYQWKIVECKIASRKSSGGEI